MSPPTIPSTYTPASAQKNTFQKPPLPEQASERARSDSPPGLAKKAELDEVRIDPKDALNKSILDTQFNVSVGAKDKPMDLLYRTVIEALKEYVEPVLGEGAIENAFESGLDVSPEATAERIVSLSTNFIAAFQEQHPELEGEALVDRFLEVIGGGIEQGFSEARDILDGLGVLEGDIASNIDKTYDLVQQGLEAFRAGYLADTE